MAKNVKADVAGKLLQSAFIDAIKETKLNIVGSPEVDPPELDTEKAYAFDAAVEVNPEIADIDFKGLELNRTKYDGNGGRGRCPVEGPAKKTLPNAKKLPRRPPDQNG